MMYTFSLPAVTVIKSHASAFNHLISFALERGLNFSARPKVLRLSFLLHPAILGLFFINLRGEGLD